MIGMIKGQVAHLSAPVACIMTAGGVAYDVELSVPSFCTLSLGGETTLFTHLHVREMLIYCSVLPIGKTEIFSVNS